MSRPCKNCGGTDRYKTGHCKVCHSKHVKNWGVSNAERLKGIKAAWAKANVEKQRIWYQAWKALNPEKARESARVWNAHNSAALAKYRKVHADTINSHKREYYRNNKDRYRVYVQNRLTRIRGSGTKLPVDIVQVLMERQVGRCVYCATSLKIYHIDHIMPIALGGAHSADNVQLLCPACNRSKGAKHPDDFDLYRRHHAKT